MRSSAGQTVEVHDGAGTVLASVDDAGNVTGAAGEPLLHARLDWEGRRDQGVNARLDVVDPDGTPLGQVRVTKFSVTPRSTRLTLAASDAGGEVARLEPGEGDGDEIVVRAGEAVVGSLRRTGRKRGLLRSSTTYRLELTGPLEGKPRKLVLAAAVRFQKLQVEAAHASQRHR